VGSEMCIRDRPSISPNIGRFNGANLGFMQ
jgi:hypothetical protein